MTFFGPSIRNGLPIGLGSAAGFGTTPFTPAELFYSGEQGFWYDPSDYTTLFQDSAGTTPVTAVEQAVGRILDKSKGLVLGPELVTNGDFSSGTGWTLGTGWSIAGGLLVANPAADFSTASQTLSTVAGQTYRAQITTVSFTSGAFRLYIFDGTNYRDFVDINTPGNYQLMWTAYTAADQIRVYAFNTTALDIASFDNVSVKALPGNHAFQTSSTKRPVLRARYNLLTYSEQFDNAVWSKSSGGTGVAPTVTANAGVAPDGTNTAERVQFNCVGSTISDRSWITQSATIANASSYTGTVYVKAFDVANVGRQLRFVVESVTSAQVITLTSDWQRVTLTGTSSVTTGSLLIETRGTVTNSATADALLWGADLRPTSQATGLIGPTYQRIAAATDYDVVGFLPYLAFEIDDALTTNNIDFTATDKMTVFAGVRKLSDAAVGMIAELSADYSSFAGSFLLDGPDSTGASGNFLFAARGSVAPGGGMSSGVMLAPTTRVLTGQADIAASSRSLRVDGTQTQSSSVSLGTGNFGNHPLFIGARNQTSLYFNGWIYSLIGRGAATTAGQISATEQWVGQRTGVQL